MTDLRNARKKQGLFLAAVFTAVMIPLTFLDLSIAKMTYHYSDLYGKIFEILGVVPTCMMGVFFAAANLQTRRIARKKSCPFSCPFFCGVLHGIHAPFHLVPGQAMEWFRWESSLRFLLCFPFT